MQWDVVNAYVAALCGIIMLGCFLAGAIGPGLGFLVLGCFFVWLSEHTS